MLFEIILNAFEAYLQQFRSYLILENVIKCPERNPVNFTSDGEYSPLSEVPNFP